MARRGSCRIIAGNWRGRNIWFDDAEGLRPTTSRVRETVFNWLQADLAGSYCLDCFAGSGVLGFEAVSRGAEHVWLLENNPVTVCNLKKNIVALAATNIVLQKVDAIRWLTQVQQQASPQTFNIVFLDPPYQAELLQQSCTLLAQSRLLCPGAKIYLEHALGGNIEVPQHWQLLKDKVAGQLVYKLYVNLPAE